MLALPVAAEPLPVVRALQHSPPQVRLGPRPRPAAVVTAVEGATFEEDLLGDATLAERALHLSEADDRALGEVLAHQVEYSDAVLAPEPFGTRPARLLAHLATGSRRIEVRSLHEAGVTLLAATRRPLDDPRGDLRQVRPAAGPDGDDGEGVWTIELASDRPLHPARLLERIEDLGQGRLRARGHFRVPTRPGSVCAWDGAGGQLSIGTLGPSTAGTRDTRIVVTGTVDPDEDVIGRLRAAFADVLLTDHEHARGPAWWHGRPDELDPWLGDMAEHLNRQPSLPSNGNP